MHSILTTVFLGFILGIKHAFETDHVIAITTMVTEQKSPGKAAVIGAFWGIGHTATLLIIGVIVLVLRISIPESFNVFFESIVALVLILTGFHAIATKPPALHAHLHTHGGLTHEHVHAEQHHDRRRRSLAIGALHGLAGSGGIMVLIVATITSVFSGILYILLFGIGSILGMTTISYLMGIPLTLSVKKFTAYERGIRLFTGAASIFIGLYLAYTIFFS